MTQPTLYEPKEPVPVRLLTVAELYRNRKLPSFSCAGGGPLSTSSLGCGGEMLPHGCKLAAARQLAHESK
jgi:hypothetical protein